MPLRLFFDEDAMARAVAHNLRQRGVDVTTVLEENRLGFSDDEQLEFATAEDRVICTCNLRDFLTLHAEYLAHGKTHSGIILIHQQRFTIGEQVLRLLRLMQARSAESMQNHIEFLSNW
jgi:hypothetical protein